MSTPPSIVPSVAQPGCVNDPLAGNKNVLAKLSTGELAANSSTGTNSTLLSSMSKGTHNHGDTKHSTGE